MNRERLAWAAGFFDGEGSIGCYDTTNNNKVSRYRSPRLMIQIAQTDREVLDKFAEAVGVGRVTGPFEPKTKNSKPYWCYRTENFENVQNIVCVMWIWLSEQKRNDASKSIKKYLKYANDAQCRFGHGRKRNKRGVMYCPTCFSERGTRNMNVRWNNV